MFKCVKCVKDFCESTSGKFFLLGAASAVVATKILKTKKAKDVCVSGVAKTMKLYKDAQNTLQNLKEVHFFGYTLRC